MPKTESIPTVLEDAAKEGIPEKRRQVAGYKGRADAEHPKNNDGNAQENIAKYRTGRQTGMFSGGRSVKGEKESNTRIRYSEAIQERISKT